MSNVLSEAKKQQVLALGRLGWPLRRIEEATGVRRETASAYLRSAGVPIRPPRGWGHAKPAKGVITDLPVWPTRCRSPAASACEPYREVIERGVAMRRNAMAIWQELFDRHGFAAGYPSVMRFVRKLRGERAREAHPVIVTEPGDEAQVDYGEGPMVRDGATGKYRRTRLFVMTLGCSRKSVRLLAWRSSARTWCELHETAFRRLGGATRIVVLDNLKEGVHAADVYDPALNRKPSSIGV
jgi:transposase